MGRRLLAHRAEAPSTKGEDWSARGPGAEESVKYLGGLQIAPPLAMGLDWEPGNRWSDHGISWIGLRRSTPGIDSRDTLAPPKAARIGCAAHRYGGS